MIRIYKFPLAVATDQTISIQRFAKILCVQIQDGRPCLWAEVDDNNLPTQRMIAMTGTGYIVPSGQYIGTVQLNGYVWHFYDQG